MKELLLRTLTGISLIVLIAGSILISPVSFLLVIMLVYGLSLRELFSVYNQRKYIAHCLVAISGGLLLPLTYLGLQFHISLLWFIVPALLWSIGYLWSDSRYIGSLALFWLAIPLTSFYALGWFSETNSYHPVLPLSVIALVWINDIFAYVVGSLMGKHKIAPRLSPGKTWEGFFGGVVFTLLGGWLTFRLTGEFAGGTWIVLSMIISLFGLIGDLFESSLKRRINIKNTGNLLPGHGGILDRFDSLLFVAPLVLLLIVFMHLYQ
ncbi:MAG: phosphatidate cytidylyltransferase [Bacteroidales bacterium]|nr:phosphatidate cytidylyltransferase [Bacteroidales bacterium]